MRYFEILAEAKSPAAKQAIIKRYGSKLEERIKKDNREKELSVEDLLVRMEEVDPTPKSAYVDWLVREYLRGNIRYIEDIGKAAEFLPRYEKLKPKLPVEQRNVLAFEFNGLWDFVRSKEDVDARSSKQIEADMEKEFYKTGQAKLLRNDGQWKVVELHSREAAVFFGRNTKWCTAARDNNMFEEYYADGPLIMGLHKPTNSRWQRHDASGQFMDEEDNPIMLEENPDREEYDSYDPFDDVDPDDFEDNYEVDEEDYYDEETEEYDYEAMEADRQRAYNQWYEDQVEYNRENHAHSEQPSCTVLMREFASLIALDPTGLVPEPFIKMIKEGRANFGGLRWLAMYCKEAANGDVDSPIDEAIACIETSASSCGWKISVPAEISRVGGGLHFDVNASGDELAVMISKQPQRITELKNPSDEIIKVALDIRPHLINQIEGATDDLWFYAFTRDIESLALNKNPSADLVTRAIKHNEMAIKYVNNPSHEQYLEAISYKPNAILSIPHEKQTSDMVIAALDQSVRNLRHVNQDVIPKDYLWKLVEEHPKFVSVIHEPSDELVRMAISKEPSVVENILGLDTKYIEYAVSLEAGLAYLLPNPTDEQINSVIDRNPEKIAYVKKLTDEHLIRAVKKGINLQNSALAHPSERVMLEIIANIEDKNVARSFARKYYDHINMTDKVQMSVVRKFPFVVGELRDPTEECIWEAIKADPTAIRMLGMSQITIEMLDYVSEKDESMVSYCDAVRERKRRM